MRPASFKVSISRYFVSDAVMLKTPLGASLWFSGNEFAYQFRRQGFHPRSRKISHASEQLKLMCHNYRAWALEPTPHTY